MRVVSSRAGRKKLWKESPVLHRQLRFPGTLRPPPIDALQQHRQLRWRQRNRAAHRLWPHKTSSLQPLGEQAQTVAVIPEHFDQIAAPPTKHEHLSREWTLFQLRLYQRTQTGEAS